LQTIISFKDKNDQGSKGYLDQKEARRQTNVRPAQKEC